MLEITPRAAPIEGLLDDFLNKGAGQVANILTGVSNAFGRPAQPSGPDPALAQQQALFQAQMQQQQAEIERQRAEMQAAAARLAEEAASRQQDGSGSTSESTILGLPMPVALLAAAGAVYYFTQRR